MEFSLSNVVRPFALLAAGFVSASAATLVKPVMYVTQVPIPDESLNKTIKLSEMNITTTMMSPLADPKTVPRGGALWIRYADGTTRNLTKAANIGGPWDNSENAMGFQGANGIAVMKPQMHWSGTKAVFAMVVGAPVNAADTTVFHWQLYEITNFGQGQTPAISLVQGQPSNYNNFHACYDTQDRLIFVSDAPHGMQSNLYPRLDEYMSLPCSTGLWRLDRSNNNELKQIVDAPSGAQSPFIDSAGRVIFVQWDHFTRDPQASTDRVPITRYKADGVTVDPVTSDTWVQTFNGNGIFSSEAPGAAFTLGNVPGDTVSNNYTSYAAQNTYPEPRNFDHTALLTSNVNGNALNQFFPWECREDGSAHEVANHAGRHEIVSSVGPSFNDDLNLKTLNNVSAGKTTGLNFMQLVESPVTPGLFFATNAVEFGTHAAGPIITYQMADGVNPDTLALKYITPVVSPPNPALQNELTTPIDIFRNPTPLSNNTLLVVTTQATRFDGNLSTAATPKSRYAFRLRMMDQATNNGVTTYTLNSVFAPTTQSAVNINYYVNGQSVSYQWPLWELDPVEVVAHTKPSQLGTPIASVEQTVFDEVGVHAPTYQAYLKAHNLALLVNRNSTRRDSADLQQPYNLKVAWSNIQTLGAVVSGVQQKIYDIGWMQFMQADGIRGYTYDGTNAAALPGPGRRTMPVPLHDAPAIAENPPVANAPVGSVKLSNDGSWAAVLPAGKALSWHLMDGAGTKSQVKERYWVTFAPGEVRTCAVCHGVNTKDQANNLGAPQNKPDALYTMLNFWKAAHPPGALQHASPSAAVLKTANSATLQVTRTGGSTGPASVQYATANGTAVAGVDYNTTTGILNWLDGDTAPKTITVPLLHPSTIAADKQLSIALSGPVYGSLGNPATASVTIQEPPFESWLFSKFGAGANTPQALATADPDGDGLANLVEWELNDDPTVSSAPPAGNLANNHLTIAFTRNLTATATAIVEVSDDLVHWTAGSSYGPGGNVPNTAATSDITPAGSPAGYTVVRDNTLQSAAMHRYMHVRVEGP